MMIQQSLFTEEEYIEEARNQLVVKSNALIQRTRYSLNTQQQKIILYLISKIKPDDDELVEYDYDLKDFCKLCGIETHGQNYANLKESILQLHNKAFWIDTEDVDIMVSWIQTAYIYKKDTRLRIRLDDNLKPFLLHIRNQFTAYELQNILCMRSRYSIRLYEYLKSYANYGSVILSVDELKKILDCEKEYDRWNNFRMRVLDKALAEIKQCSDLDVDIELLRTNRAISTIVFHIYRKNSDDAIRTRLKNSAQLNGTPREDIDKW